MRNKNKERPGRKQRAGGFQGMQLLPALLKGILKKGYRQPTPIQRRTIPIVLSGRDVVAMARTGSGKTAAFLVPLFQRLQKREPSRGTRALILSPTRELALQTLAFAKQIGKFINLTMVAILGGENMDDQFAAMHQKPDVVIATPGRLLHILVEMDARMPAVEYIVFDEADRLFEMGFQEQLGEIINRLPADRQTLLFSATLPKALADFARAGLNDPELIRLDVEVSLSERLRIGHLWCRSDGDKLATLLYLLRSFLPQLPHLLANQTPETAANAGRSAQCLVFLPTKHHVEYVSLLLKCADIDHGTVYSSMDATARKINVARLQQRKINLLLVTDVAARGIDIPKLDCVINFACPSKAKLFVHRVGRVARAGMAGVAITLISPAELAYLYDIHLFAGRKLNVANDMAVVGPVLENNDCIIGSIDRAALDDELELLTAWHSTNVDLRMMRKVCANAAKQYVRSVSLPSGASVKRAKLSLSLDETSQPADADDQDVLDLSVIGVHPWMKCFDGIESGVETTAAPVDVSKQASLIRAINKYKPRSTIFEINTRSETASVARLIRETRLKSENKRQRRTSLEASVSCPPSTEPEGRTRNASDDNGIVRKKPKIRVIDPEFYVPYRPNDDHKERQLAVDGSFSTVAEGATLDLMGDEGRLRQSGAAGGHEPTGSAVAAKIRQVWDRKRKKFVYVQPNEKKIKTESGAWIAKSYKSDQYANWLKKTRQFSQHRRQTTGGSDDEDESEENVAEQTAPSTNPFRNRKGQRRRGNELSRSSSQTPAERPSRASCLKTVDEILKARKIKAHKQRTQKRNRIRNLKKCSRRKK